MWFIVGLMLFCIMLAPLRLELDVSVWLALGGIGWRKTPSSWRTASLFLPQLVEMTPVLCFYDLLVLNLSYSD